MKRFFSKLILMIVTITSGLFISLLIVTLTLGPKRTDKAIKELFQIENYNRNYLKVIPFFSQIPETGEYSKDKITDLAQDREIQDIAEVPPLLVPSSGIAPSSSFLFTGPLSEGKHEGIDIWTNTNGTGIDGTTYGKGNPVYASCSGYVRTVWKDNGDVSIICDDIDEIYKGIVPSLKVKTLYGHMADQFSDEVFIYVSEGQRVKQGDLIGHQGNRCYWAPRNRVVHLHFGVYDIRGARQIPIDPEPYIGVSCTTLNQTYTTKE